MKPYKYLAGPGRKPWKHQVEAFNWARERHQAAFFLEMGLGKTNIIGNWLIANRPKIERNLIIAPVAVADSWVEEFQRTWPMHRVLNLASMGSTAARIRALKKDLTDFVIINYDGVRSLEDELSEWLGKKGAIVCDESTNIKNAQAKRTQAIVRLGDQALYRALATGTPAPQGPEDIFGQYLFLDPNIFGVSFYAFRARFFDLGGFTGKQIIRLKPSMMKEYKALVHTCAIRKTKAECLDMPPKVYEVRKYDLSGPERKVYDALAKEWIAEMESGTISATNGMTKGLRLAQVCTGFAGATHDAEKITMELGSTKLKELEELVDELPEGTKFIVWCAWKKNVKDVLKMLAKKGIKGVDYTGDTADRRANEMAFRNDDEVKAFVGTAASGGAGLNLQGPLVQTVIYYSQGYSVFERQQSEDRAHRGNIKHTVTIIDLVARNTIEGSILRCLTDGVDVQNAVMKTPSAFAKGE